MTMDRLYLRDTNFEDCSLFAKWETDPVVTTFFTISDGRGYEEIVREHFQRENDETQKEFTICLKETDKPIGRIYISNINDHYDSLDISRIYIADTTYRGKGYGEEALKLALEWSFGEMKMQRVTLDHFANNVIANSLYKKLGFIPEGTMRNCGKKNGKYVDLCLMSMLRDEYYVNVKKY
ncbi:MAG: GNAT family N-acetyltransferase [Firmicutes bacterium]|nr:GNAT family N-acetyltransferase [Bacillota bacterium]